MNALRPSCADSRRSRNLRALTLAFGCALAGSSSMAADPSTAPAAQVAKAGWGTARRPFAATSPWNSRPVAPVFGDFVIPKSDYLPNVGENEWSVPVFVVGEKDPAVTVTGVSDTQGLFDPDEERVHAVTLPRWPAGVASAAGSDGHAEVVDPWLGVVHSFWQLRKSGDHWTAALYAWAPLGGRGWGDPAHYDQGARAAGVPSLGGLIRTYEVDDGDTMYRHALAASLTFNGLSPKPAYVFPATSADTGAETGNSGRIPEGALLMLPAAFDVQQLATPALRKVAQTLKVYGAYVVDRNVGTPYFIYAEIGSGLTLHKHGWNNDAANDLEKMRLALRQVVSTGGWLDGDGKPYAPDRNLNILSMRGPWRVESGGQPGTYESWQQAVVFPQSASMRTVQISDTGRAIVGTAWAVPAVGASYRITCIATGGAKLRFQLRTKGNGGVAQYDSGELADGQSATFAWPGDDIAVTYAISGTGRPSSVRGTILAVAR